MERTQISIEPTAVAKCRDSEEHIGVTLAQRQLGIVRSAYAQAAATDIKGFWDSESARAVAMGREAAMLELIARRRFALRLGRVFLLLSPCIAIASWGFGVAAGCGALGVIVIFSFVLGVSQCR